MTKTRLFTFLTYPIVALFAYLLYDGINGTIQKARDIEVSEAKVIRRLKEIRAAEKGFHAYYGRYTADWDSLTTFVKTGIIYLVDKHEKIMQRPANESYKGDSILVVRDTVGTEKAIDNLFINAKNSKGELEFPNFNPDKLSLIPDYEAEGKKFKITAGKIEKGSLFVDVIEVIDNMPLDKSRKEDHSNRRRHFLRFGSMEEASVSGNWED